MMWTCWETLLAEPYSWPVKTEDQFRNSPKGGSTDRCVWTVVHDEVGSLQVEVWKPNCTNYTLTGPGRHYEWVKHGGDQGSKESLASSSPRELSLSDTGNLNFHGEVRFFSVFNPHFHEGRTKQVYDHARVVRCQPAICGPGTRLQQSFCVMVSILVSSWPGCNL